MLSALLAVLHLFGAAVAIKRFDQIITSMTAAASTGPACLPSRNLPQYPMHNDNDLANPVHDDDKTINLGHVTHNKRGVYVNYNSGVGV